MWSPINFDKKGFVHIQHLSLGALWVSCLRLLTAVTCNCKYVLCNIFLSKLTAFLQEFASYSLKQAAVTVLCPGYVWFHCQYHTIHNRNNTEVSKSCLHASLQGNGKEDTDVHSRPNLHYTLSAVVTGRTRKKYRINFKYFGVLC
jgi:hypothetical protein